MEYGRSNNRSGIRSAMVAAAGILFLSTGPIAIATESISVADPSATGGSATSSESPDAVSPLDSASKPSVSPPTEWGTKESESISVTTAPADSEPAASAEAEHPKPLRPKKKKGHSKAATQVDNPPNTAEIPPAKDREPPVVTVEPDPITSTLNGQNQIEEYQAAQSPMVPPSVAPHLHTLQEFVNQVSDLSQMGMDLREDSTKLSDGEEIAGLAIVNVRRGSPAAAAGLRSYRSVTHDVLEGASVAAALFFPPAILALTMIDQTRVGESFDLIVGVDGHRVSNVIDFEDQMRNIKPGDIVYLNLVRDGARMQLPVKIADTISN